MKYRKAIRDRFNHGVDLEYMPVPVWTRAEARYNILVNNEVDDALERVRRDYPWFDPYLPKCGYPH